MAFENLPHVEANKEANQQSKQSSGVRPILVGALIVALLGTWGYIIWDKNNTRETIQQKETIIASTSNQRDELQKELEDATMRYDLLKTSHTKKDSLITAKDREIAEKKDKIRILLAKSNASAEELKEARQLIASLNTDIENYKSQIDVLQGEKIQLTNEKTAIAQQRDKVQQQFDSSLSVIKAKEDVIDVGSTLHASNFSIIGVDVKGNGKEKITSTAKKVDKLRISFDLDENMITQSGNKELYIIITDPEGKVVSEAEQGSGVFTTRDAGSKEFTQRIEVNYIQNRRQTVSFDWKQNKQFSTGNYKIEVYNNGFKVGESYRPLKKGGLFG
jgi:DNA repair exonuclease SbcCD ATPase subunit